MDVSPKSENLAPLPSAQHTPRPNRALARQLMVLLPTLAVSVLLGYAGLPPVPRLAASLGFGAVLIAGLAYFRR
jgi:hypothetical protein